MAAEDDGAYDACHGRSVVDDVGETAVYTYVGGYAGAWDKAGRAEGCEKDALRSGCAADCMRGPKMLSNAAARLSAVGGSPRLREGMAGR